MQKQNKTMRVPRRALCFCADMIIVDLPHLTP